MPISIKKSILNIKNNSDYDDFDAFWNGDINSAINAWLTNHPEATTTVQDNSITEAKLNETVRTKKPNFYKTSFDMIDDTGLIVGMYAVTLGYHEKSDDGGAVYYIREANQDIADNGKIFLLDNGLIAECITDFIPYSGYIKHKNTAKLYHLSTGTDISSMITAAFAVNGVDVVVVPEGSYKISNTVEILDNKTLVLQGDYKNPSLSKTIITTDVANLTLLKLGNRSHLVGGSFQLGAVEGIKAIVIDIHNKDVAFSTVKKTIVVGGRESNGVLSQTAVYIECDDLTETTTEHGYLMQCEFDMQIENVCNAYHFHRQRASGTASGVWLTQNDIYGYIRHCTRYVFYDFASEEYANNDSVMGATCQAGSRVTGEENYPGINLKGKSIAVIGKMWDFDSLHQTPAVLFDTGCRNAVVYRDCSISHAYGNRAIDNNLSLGRLLRDTAFKKITGTANDEAISNLTSYSYRVGHIAYLNFDFKIPQSLLNGVTLFSVDDDAWINQCDLDIVNKTTGAVIARVIINADNQHNVVLKTSASSPGDVWCNISGISLSTTIINN